VGAGDVPRNNTSEQQYPNLQKECEVLTTDVLAKTVGADPQDIQSTFVGAICRWQAANPGGLIDITRFWFEQGSLDNERKIAEFLKYQIENRAIAGVPSIVMKPNDPNGSCGVASDAAGVVGWWVNPQVPGIDAARRPSNSWSSRSRPIRDIETLNTRCAGRPCQRTGSRIRNADSSAKAIGPDDLLTFETVTGQ